MARTVEEIRADLLKGIEAAPGKYVANLREDLLAVLKHDQAEADKKAEAEKQVGKK